LFYFHAEKQSTHTIFVFLHCLPLVPFPKPP
jgi:hypothetical protein